MALYAFDGTWNQVKDNDVNYKDTNVVRFHDAYKKHSGTKDLYVPGVGTRFNVLGAVLGGAFGLGELARLEDAYRYLCDRWSEGDRTIDIIGFSRGAATTLDFCEMIQERGIRQKDGTVIEAKPTIRFLGVWDVVAGFGLANLGMTDWNIGHHLSLPEGSLRYAFHALALDERRPSFLPTRLEGAYEVWFRGVHSDVGGGDGNQGLNDITLKWMMNKALAAGLPIAEGDMAALRPDASSAPQPNMQLPFDVRFVDALDRRHYTVPSQGNWRVPPATCKVETEEGEKEAAPVGAVVMTLSPQARRAVAVLAETAERTALARQCPLQEEARQALFNLIEGRIPLVQTEEQLTQAREATIVLVGEMVRQAENKGFRTLGKEFFLTAALFEIGAIFPFAG